jgi:superfamily II DNA/RNA helicase
VFKTILKSQPSDDDPGPSSSPPPEPAIREPLLLVSGNESSPKQDVERFLSFASDIVIGTPGRIEEFLIGKGKATVSVKELEVLVLDEADR